MKIEEGKKKIPVESWDGGSEGGKVKKVRGEGTAWGGA